MKIEKPETSPSNVEWENIQDEPTLPLTDDENEDNQNYDQENNAQVFNIDEIMENNGQEPVNDEIQRLNNLELEHLPQNDEIPPPINLGHLINIHIVPQYIPL